MSVRTEYASEIVCPYCGHTKSNPCEIESNFAELECGECCRIFLMERHVLVSYSTYEKYEESEVENERTTQLRLDALFECHNVRHNSIVKAMRAVQRAINENPLYSELEHAKSNLNLALIRERIDYENRVKLETEGKG